MGSSQAYPYTGVQRNLLGSSLDYMSILISVSVSLCLYVSLPLRLVVRVAFRDNKSVARNFVQRMRAQVTGSNTLSGSMVCTSVLPSGHPWEFLKFLNLY